MKTRAQAATEMQQALDLVEENTSEDWAADALRAIETVCHQKAEFICDDVWETGLASMHNDKALGPVMMRAKRLGYCVKTDRLRASVRSHLSGKPVWKSLLFGGIQTISLEAEG